MKLTLFLIVVFIGLAHSRIVKHSIKDRQDQLEIPEDHEIEVHFNQETNKKYSSKIPESQDDTKGSGQKSIAQGSADEAFGYVASQHAAAQQSTYKAKITLAQSAVQVAATANAALAGKEILLKSLKEHAKRSHLVLKAEILQLELAKQAAAAAKASARQADQQVAALTEALNSAKLVSENIELAATEAVAELASQTSMVDKAKNRLQTVQRKLHSVQIDHKATEIAAAKASAAAERAQENANNAGSHSSENFEESA